MAKYYPHYLYQLYIVFPPARVSSFAVINIQFLFRWTESILTVSILPSLTPAPPWLPAHSQLSPSCSGTPSWNGLSCCIPCMSCCKLDTASVHGSHHNTCMGITDLSCLVHILQCPLLTFWWLSLCQIGVIQLCYLAQPPELSAPLFFLPILTHPHWSLVHHYFWVVNSLIISSNMHVSLSPWINCSLIGYLTPCNCILLLPHAVSPSIHLHSHFLVYTTFWTARLNHFIVLRFKFGSQHIKQPF